MGRNFECGGYFDSVPEVPLADISLEQTAVSEEATAIRPPENPEWGPNRSRKIPETDHTEIEPASDAVAVPIDLTNGPEQHARLARFVLEEGDIEITYRPGQE
ncbi:MAG TPA: hypothetical protein VHT70_03590 [Candidatus Saccharimonadales bacterium]|jgi:hypothetical protein|nr:hypothetical protein [Candidatus Saccharimonadales bacterium]